METQKYSVLIRRGGINKRFQDVLKKESNDKVWFEVCSVNLDLSTNITTMCCLLIYDPQSHDQRSYNFEIYYYKNEWTFGLKFDMIDGVKIERIKEIIKNILNDKDFVEITQK